MLKSRRRRAIQVIISAVALSLSSAGAARGAPQNEAPQPSLQSEIDDLRAQMATMKSQMAAMRAETAQLRSELAAARPKPAPDPLAALPQSGSLQEAQKAPAASQPAAAAQSPLQKIEERVAGLEEDEDVLKSEVKDQSQEKVESASKYQVHLSGIALFNAYMNRGAADSQDVPQIAESPSPGVANAAFGATVRQSQIGLDVFGPTVAGARVRGQIDADFFGGFSPAPNGETSGLMRVRTATVRLDWGNTSLVAGQDSLFFAPVSPTSFASLAEPAFAYSGNLWAWAPQIRIERRFTLSDDSALTLTGGIIDSLTGEPAYSGYYKAGQAGERSGQPAFAGRAAWQQTRWGRTASLGVGAYYGEQNWGFGRIVSAWAISGDWRQPLDRWFSFSGEIYRGRAIGGLGAGEGRSVLYTGALANPLTSVLGLNAVGGWGQLKFRPIERLEFNAAFGEDQPFASDLGRFPLAQSYFDPSLSRNQSGLVNVIFYPRSDLVLSLEYRRLMTGDTSGAGYRAGQINLGIGVLF